VNESVKRVLNEAPVSNEGSTEYTVAVGISGVASTRVRANSPEEAKQIALEHCEMWGNNDYFWWYDSNNPTIAVSETETQNPEVIDINELRNDKNWVFV
jgi:hypothetical protein